MIANEFNSIPWAAIGAGLAGLGSFLTGLAAYRQAMRRGNDEPKRDADAEAD